MKSIALALLVIGASGAAFAQGNGPAGTDPGAYGTTGTTRTKDVGRTTPNVAQDRGGATSSSSMEMQRQKKANEQGLPSTTYSNTK
jgi:hypothetical protein